MQSVQYTWSLSLWDWTSKKPIDGGWSWLAPAQHILGRQTSGWDIIDTGYKQTRVISDNKKVQRHASDCFQSQCVCASTGPSPTRGVQVGMQYESVWSVSLANGRGENQKEAGSGMLRALPEKSRDEGRRRWSRLKFLPRQLQPLLLCSLRLKQRKHCTKSTLCDITVFFFADLYSILC